MTRKEQIKGLYALKEYLMRNPIELEGHKSLPITLIDYAIETLEQEPCDCISRAEVIKALEYDLSIETDSGFDKYRTVINALLKAIYNTQKKAIEDLPSVQPIAKNDLSSGLEKNSKKLEKGSEWQKDHAILKAYSDGANEVLDKIRAEIEEKADGSVGEIADGLYDALEIIDKYKAESENP